MPYGCLLSQAFSSRYFSWTSGDPHCSGFKLHTAVLSILCVMFQVQLSFVVNQSNVFYYCYYYYYTIWMSLVTGLFFPVLLLNQRWYPPLTLQASHCSTFHIMCDVPSTAVFCSESIKCFLLLLLLLLLYDIDVSCHRPFLPGTSLEPAVIPTAQASSFTLQYFPYYLWCSKYRCLL